MGPVKPYTGGCVAIPQDRMLTVMQNVKENCVVVMEPMDTLIPELWDTLNLSGAAAGGKQTVSAYLDQDGNSITVTVDISGGWSASFARGAVYLYDGEETADREAAAMGITLEKEIYDEYIEAADTYADYQEENGAVSYTDELGDSVYLYPAGDAAYFMITVFEGNDGDAVSARISTEPGT